LFYLQKKEKHIKIAVERREEVSNVMEFLNDESIFTVWGEFEGYVCDFI
jgi:hypothetical protein